MSGTRNGDCWDVNMDLNYPQPSTDCERPHQVKDNWNRTEIQLIYFLDTTFLACDIEDEENWLSTTKLSNQAVDSILLFDHLDIGDPVIYSPQLGQENTIVCGEQTDPMINGIDLRPAFGSTFRGLAPSSSFDFTPPKQSDILISTIEWGFSPDNASFAFSPPSTESTCLSNWVVKRNGVIKGTQDSLTGEIVVNESLNVNSSSYTLQASVTSCQCDSALFASEQGFVDVVIQYGPACGCEGGTATCLSADTLGYNLEELVGGLSATASVIDNTTCDSLQVGLSTSLFVDKGSYRPTVLRIPIVDGLEPLQGSAMVEGTTYCLHLPTTTSSHWEYQLLDSATCSDPLLVEVPNNTNIVFDLSFRPTGHGIFVFEPQLSGFKNCGDTASFSITEESLLPMVTFAPASECDTIGAGGPCALLFNPNDTISRQAKGFDHLQVGSELLIVGSLADGAGNPNAYAGLTDGTTISGSVQVDHGDVADSYRAVYTKDGKYFMAGSYRR